MSLSKLKNADNRTKLLIFGYSRKKIKELSMQNFPSMIQYMFLMYYWIQEKFTMLGDNMYLDENNSNLIHLKHASDPKHADNPRLAALDFPAKNAAYGNNVINYKDTSIQKYIWSFRYNNEYKCGVVCFGIVASNEQLPNASLLEDRKCDYHVFCQNGRAFNSTDRKDAHGHNEILHHLWPRTLPRAGTLSLILDVTECKLYLKCKIDEIKGEYVVSRNIDLENVKFNMAVSAVTRVGEEIELISFQIVQKCTS